VELTLTTPALLFPAISLMMLAYTNRFLALAALMRDLHSQYQEKKDEHIKDQLENLRYRIVLIKNMQVFGVASFFGCVLTMFLIFTGCSNISPWVFGGSLFLLLISLGLSLREVQVSIEALSLQIKDMNH
jgi:hypothetical protein